MVIFFYPKAGFRADNFGDSPDNARRLTGNARCRIQVKKRAENGQMRVKRVIIANLGKEEHWSGMFCARTLRDAGVEVIYLGSTPPESIADAAVQEDVDMILLETTSVHHQAAPEIVKILRGQEAGDIPVVLGGEVPPEDVPKLMKAGIVRIFGPGTSLQGIIEIISAHAR